MTVDVRGGISPDDDEAPPTWFAIIWRCSAARARLAFFQAPLLPVESGCLQRCSVVDKRFGLDVAALDSAGALAMGAETAPVKSMVANGTGGNGGIGIGGIATGVAPGVAAIAWVIEMRLAMAPSVVWNTLIRAC